ncbi:eukaryotic translation initiation factor 2 subunit 1-like [Uloborus diversus]|uniref:eukaryotic translation initiation factor 2 subunit 1-like n=1 Tax=Uloborus diversus TaxID=327109 RepID=UPI0024098823|nr:eukaryotic translation initiation factor 2 subunit 1-like [Uloborus diversus]
MGAYVHLLEYDNMNAMILISEVTRKRIRSLQKLLRVGSTECAVVIRVDVEKQYVDLSKCRVTEEDASLCLKRYAKAKAIYSILHNVAQRLGFTSSEQLEELFENTTWCLERKLKRKAVAYDVFKKAVENTALLDDLNLDNTTRRILHSVITNKLSSGSIHIRTDIDVTCFEKAGIDGIKSALKAGLQMKTENVLLKIQLIATPTYMLLATAQSKDQGEDVVYKALKAIEAEIKSYGGNFKMVFGPKIVTECETDIQDPDKFSAGDEDISDE